MAIVEEKQWQMQYDENLAETEYMEGAQRIRDSPMDLQ